MKTNKKQKETNVFTLFWLDGKREVIEGNTIASAFTFAGYGAGAIRALDFYSNGDDTSYIWIRKDRTWEKKEVLTFRP